jgi:hypothetical protein
MSKTFTAISGSVYDVYTSGFEEQKQNRIPYLGQTLVSEDGRKYVFCSTAVDITVGTAVGPHLVSNLNCVATTKKGGTFITISAAGTKAHELKESFVFFPQATADVYDIVDNTVADGDDNVVIELDRNITVQLDIGNTVSVRNLRSSLVVKGIAGGDLVGVCVASVTAGTVGKTQSFWAQYGGYAPCNTAITLNDAITSAASGAVASATEGDQIFGQCVLQGAHSLINWNCPIV